MSLNKKRVNRVVMYLDDREFIDFSAEAERFDKSAGSLLRFAALRFMYGTVRMAADENKFSDSVIEAHTE